MFFITFVCIVAGVPASIREDVWQWLSRQYQAAHLPQWSFPEELCGEEAFTRLSQQNTEYEHSITVDIGTTCTVHNSLVYIYRYI